MMLRLHNRENPAAEGRDQYGVQPFSDVKDDPTLIPSGLNPMLILVSPFPDVKNDYPNSKWFEPIFVKTASIHAFGDKPHGISVGAA